MLTVRKLDGGYIVQHGEVEQVAHADNVAHLIIRFWPDVYEHIEEHVRRKIEEEQKEGVANQ